MKTWGVEDGDKYEVQSNLGGGIESSIDIVEVAHQEAVRISFSGTGRRRLTNLHLHSSSHSSLLRAWTSSILTSCLANTLILEDPLSPAGVMPAVSKRISWSLPMHIPLCISDEPMRMWILSPSWRFERTPTRALPDQHLLLRCICKLNVSMERSDPPLSFRLTVIG